MLIKDAVDGFTLNCYARGLSETTVDWYEVQLKVFGEYTKELGVKDISIIKREHLVGFMAKLRAKEPALTPHSLHNYASALRQLFSYLADERFIDSN